MYLITGKSSHSQKKTYMQLLGWTSASLSSLTGWIMSFHIRNICFPFWFWRHRKKSKWKAKLKMKTKVDIQSDKRKGKKFKTETASALKLKAYREMETQQKEIYKPKWKRWWECKSKWKRNQKCLSPLGFRRWDIPKYWRFSMYLDTCRFRAHFSGEFWNCDPWTQNILEMLAGLTVCTVRSRVTELSSFSSKLLDKLTLATVLCRAV